MISMSYVFFRLVALVEVLQKRKLKHNKRPQSQPHSLENITIALDAIQEDGIKLVNIGESLASSNPLNVDERRERWEHHKLWDIQGSAKHQTQNTAQFRALINLFPFQRYRGCMNKNRVIKKDHKKYRAIDMTYISSFCSQHKPS